MKKNTPTMPIYPSSKDPTSVFSLKTSASCECVNDKAKDGDMKQYMRYNQVQTRLFKSFDEQIFHWLNDSRLKGNQRRV